MGLMDMVKKLKGGMKKGGPVRKTGLYQLHAGEYVVPATKRRATKTHKRTVTKA